MPIDAAGAILILTGPPGSGKTTVARRLAAMPGSAKVHLHSDDFWGFIRHGALAPWLPEAHWQNGVVIDVVAGAAATYAGGGYLVILDGIVGPWFLAPFRALPAPVHYVVLRPTLEESIARCRARGGDTLTDAETIAALYRQFEALGPLERHALPVAGLSPEASAAAVAAALAGGGFRLAAT